MTTLTIKDLAKSEDLDREAMTALAGGRLEEMPISRDLLGALILNYTGIDTSFPVDNSSHQFAFASNSVGAFNFGNVNQSNNQVQISGQVGNVLAA